MSITERKESRPPIPPLPPPLHLREKSYLKPKKCGKLLEDGLENSCRSRRVLHEHCCVFRITFLTGFISSVTTTASATSTVLERMFPTQLYGRQNRAEVCDSSGTPASARATINSYMDLATSCSPCHVSGTKPSCSWREGWHTKMQRPTIRI